MSTEITASAHSVHTPVPLLASPLWALHSSAVVWSDMRPCLYFATALHAHTYTDTQWGVSLSIQLEVWYLGIMSLLVPQGQTHSPSPLATLAKHQIAGD